MKNMTRFAVVALAAMALVTVVFACEGDKAAGCNHADAAKADGGGCQHAKAEAAKADGKGCPHAEAMAAKEEGGCAHSKVTDAQRAALAKGSNVTLVGRVVCASCDLKTAASCKSMFKTDDGQLYAIVSSEAFEKLAGETKHGEKKVEISGTAGKDGDQQIVQPQSFKILS
jgi:uncharacterized Zn ribbon protein